MTVARSDLKFVKSETVTDTDSNGGRMSYIEVLNRTKYNLFPRVTRPERIAGITRYRKEFIWNKNSNSETAFDVSTYLTLPSLADDYFRIALGTQTDTQGDAKTDPSYKWFGSGSLATSITGGDLSISISFEELVDLRNDTLLAITNHFLQSQPILATVKVLNQVYFNGASWIPQNAGSVELEDIYPYGTCIELLGGNLATIFSYKEENHLEYHRVSAVVSTEYMAPTPDGIEVDFTLTCNGSNLPIEPETAMIQYTISSSTYEVYDNGLGAFIGAHFTSGTIDYATGVIHIVFNTPPVGSNVVVNYQKSNVTWSGFVATVTLADAMLNDFSIANSDTFIGMCLPVGDLIASASASWSLQTGNFDVTQVLLTNMGTIEQFWTFAFSSGTDFLCTGDTGLSLGIGNISSTFSPQNPDQNSPYFTIPIECWDGVIPIAGDNVILHTIPSSHALWWKEVVPAGASAYSNNIVLLEIYVE